jgi:hypothetical protein
MKMIDVFTLVLVSVTLTGCSNALYFYQTERIAMVLEARPDSSQPVQGSLGIKHRIALIAPAKEKEGESVSALSTFRFQKEAGTAGGIGPVTIRSTLLTGKAAHDLDQTQTTAAVTAMADGELPTWNKIAGNALADAERAGTLVELGSLANKPYKDLDYEEKQRLGRLTGALKNYDLELHHALQSEMR